MAKKRSDFATANREAAGVILSDVQRYGGRESALVQWADAILNRGIAGDSAGK